MKDQKTTAKSYLDTLRRCLDEIEQQDIRAVADLLFEVYRKGKTVYIFGNGGSAATANHVACDFNKTASTPNKPRLKAISLADNIALITAVGNDINYDSIFSYQLEGIIGVGDVVIAISGSGNSSNILKAVTYAKQQGAKIIAFTGFGGGKLKPMADICINLESQLYGPVEDVHLILDHMLTAMLKERIQDGK